MDTSIIVIDSDESDECDSPKKSKDKPTKILNTFHNTSSEFLNLNNNRSLQVREISKFNQQQILNNSEFLNVKIPKDLKVVWHKVPKEDNNDTIIFEPQNNKTNNCLSKIRNKNTTNIPKAHISGRINCLKCKIIQCDEILNIQKEQQLKKSFENQKKIQSTNSKQTNKNLKTNNMHRATQNNILEGAELTFPLSHTSNYYADPMNPIILPNNLSLLPSPPVAHQNSIPRSQMSTTEQFLQKNMFLPTDFPNIYQNPTYPVLNNLIQTGFYNNVMMLNQLATPNNNFWMNNTMSGIVEETPQFPINQQQNPSNVECTLQMQNIMPNVTGDVEISQTFIPQSSLVPQINEEFKNFSTDDKKDASSKPKEVTVASTSKRGKQKKVTEKYVPKKPRVKNENVTVRRNPQRKVRLQREFKKLYNIDTDDSDLEDKYLATIAMDQMQQPEEKKVKSSEDPLPSAATYSPPSPLSEHHMRFWPVDGMHERPEYNPSTSTVEKFDSVTRNITKTYNRRIPKKRGKPKSKTPPLPEQAIVFNFKMLNNIIGFIATIIQNEEKNIEMSKEQQAEEDKIKYLYQIGLQPKINKYYEEVRNILKSAVCDQENSNIEELKDVVKDGVLTYCMTYNIDQLALAGYLDSLTMEDIQSIKMSNMVPF